MSSLPLPLTSAGLEKTGLGVLRSISSASTLGAVVSALALGGDVKRFTGSLPPGLPVKSSWKDVFFSDAAPKADFVPEKALNPPVEVLGGVLVGGA